MSWVGGEIFFPCLVVDVYNEYLLSLPVEVFFHVYLACNFYL